MHLSKRKSRKQCERMIVYIFEFKVIFDAWWLTRTAMFATWASANRDTPWVLRMYHECIPTCNSQSNLGRDNRDPATACAHFDWPNHCAMACRPPMRRGSRPWRRVGRSEKRTWPIVAPWWRERQSLGPWRTTYVVLARMEEETNGGDSRWESLLQEPRGS